MKRVGVMGGTFDPCHRGHINLAKDAKEQGALDKIILMPNSIQPFKKNHKVTDAKHRLNMLRVAVESMPDIEVSSWEIEQKEISYTYKTLETLKENMGCDCKIYFIIGIDAFLNIEKWKEFDKLISNNKFIVGVRPGYKEDELKDKIQLLTENYKTEIVKIDNKKFHISSTEIRNRIFRNEEISDLVTNEVRKYINENDLYRC